MNVNRYGAKRATPHALAAAALLVAGACNDSKTAETYPHSERIAAETADARAAGPQQAQEPGTGALAEKGIVRLPSGDSVEVVGMGPARVPNQPPGVLFIYHPFFSPPEDTSRIVRMAKELWRTTVRQRLHQPLPPFVVLQATSRRAGPITGVFTEATYGVVLERRPDGRWYRLRASEPVE